MRVHVELGLPAGFTVSGERQEVCVCMCFVLARFNTQRRREDDTEVAMQDVRLLFSEADEHFQ